MTKTRKLRQTPPSFGSDSEELEVLRRLANMVRQWLDDYRDFGPSIDDLNDIMAEYDGMMRNKSRKN